MTTSKKMLSHIINFVGDVIDKNYDGIPLSQNIFTARSSETDFAGIIKIASMFIKTNSKAQK